MKLRDLVLNFYIYTMFLGTIYIFPRSVLFGISTYFPLLNDRTQAKLQEQKEGQGTEAKQGLAAIPCNFKFQISSLENCGS
jgi:hypothetical protein